MLPGSPTVINGSSFVYDVKGMGTASGRFPGEFTVTVARLIQTIFAYVKTQQWGQGPVLHLFSGASGLGDVRVDLSSDAATDKVDVFEWLKSDVAQQKYSVVLLDPPYDLSPKKMRSIGYAGWKPLATSVPHRQAFATWARQWACSVVWLDACAPKPKGFDRAAMYTLLPGGYHRVRILSFLTNPALVGSTEVVVKPDLPGQQVLFP